MHKISTVIAAALLTGGLLFTASPQAAYAQSVDAGSITRSLAPKKPLTRSFSKPKRDADDDFLEALPTRGIRIDQRKKLDEIVAKKELPSIDVEIAFDFDSDQIKPSSIADVDELGKALTSDELAKSRIVLNGHTDAKGSDEYNQNLSDRRAAAVRNYLIRNFGIGEDRLIAIGYGEERLKNPNDPESGENRRVEIINLTQG